MTEHFFFYTGLTLLLIHEMDAVRCNEWRIIPGLSVLNDKWGFRIFITAHIPLFLFILLGLSTPALSESLIFGLNIFFVVHFGLHLFLLKNKKNEFNDWISWTFITGAGICGLSDFVLAYIIL